MPIIMKTVARTWSERLFSWPWNPWVKTKQVRDLKAEFARPPHATQRAYAGHVPPRPMPPPAPPKS